DDHLFLPSPDVHLPVRGDLTDVAGVEPAVFERARGLVVGVEVAARHVLAAHENLAVVGDLHLDAGDRLADRSLLRAERMVQRDDRRRLGQPVALNDGEAELAPERFERRIERCGADDERPELQAERAMNLSVAPPAQREVLAARLPAFALWRFGEVSP